MRSLWTTGQTLAPGRTVTIGERHQRVGAERHRPVLAVVVVILAPEFTAAGGDEQEQPVGIGDLAGFAPRLGSADLYIGRHFSGLP